jgi:serine/threonine-protein kinase
MGSYLVVLTRPGYRDVRYPVFIGRNRHWSATVNLYTDEEIGPGFLYVPAGPFIQGDEPGPTAGGLPRAEAFVDDVFIAEHPVTTAEYLEFVNDLAGRDREEALKRSPRRYVEGGSFLVPTPDGRFALPEVDSEGDVWHPRWPVTGISSYDAIAYCEWRSARDGRSYRLPSELEWEKAARGVDGRAYPWGDRFDPCLCNLRGSLRERCSPVPVDEFPTDVSPYGVRGMGGNVTDWTASEAVIGLGSTARGYGIIRGGSWNFPPSHALSTYRSWVSPTLVDGRLGFRLAASPPRRGAQ